MTPERLRQIEELFHAVRERSAGERPALLAQADPELRREVESLLAGHGGDLFLNRPVIEAMTQLIVEPVSAMPAAGTLLGRYRVEGKLGEGGMGEVFRAMDTRLGRAVAIKITHERFSARFDREARAIASLNHPNICTLYDVGPNYLVMELVDGETLASLLQQGPLPADRAVRYGMQILAALSQAHGRGIVHRDLKPGNVMLAGTGIKVLDFGLASVEGDVALTAERMVMGTPAYMAPEQREGRPADARSDIYSFGCVLHELLTGRRVVSRRMRVPSRRLERVLDRCLEEHPERRWQSAAEVERELSATPAAAGRGTRAVRGPARRSPNRASVKSTIVLADFANATGDPSFDGPLRQILAAQLDNAPRLTLLPDTRVRETLGMMRRAADPTLTADLAAEICERTASAALVEGSITSLGNEYVINVRMRNCRSGQILSQEQARATKHEDVFKALAQIAKRFGTRAGGSVEAVEEEPSLPAEATTSSLEAWRSYSAAMKALQARAQSSESLSLLKRATEIDPTFAMAHATLGRLHSDLGEPETGAQSIAKAYELRHSVSDGENYYITISSHRQVTRTLELARQTLESWKHRYPGQLLPHGFLSGFASTGLGRYDTAVQEGLKAIEIDPDFSIGYENVAWAYVYLNCLSEAEGLLRKAAERKIAVNQFSLIRYAISFLRGDEASMEREASQRQAALRAQGLFEHQEALTCACRGRLKEAARLSDRAVTSARQGGLLERAAQFQGARAAWNALFENAVEAHAMAAAALALCRSRDADYGPAFALAILDDSGQVHQIEAALAERYPHDTSVQFNYLPVLRALDALNRGDAAAALEITRAATAYDLAIPATAFFTGAFFGALYPVYVRGLAYAALGRSGEAATEFRVLLDHAGLVLNDPIGSMARLQLGRALCVSGHRAEAAAVYTDLLVLWKDADPASPVVQQARAEYSSLNGVSGSPR
jgi:tetratricopeptide (TPR) repeat protein/predicted Ser/Thr protein kinase